MKKGLLFCHHVSLIAMTVNAQLVINENFTSYTNGNLGTQGGWVNFGRRTRCSNCYHYSVKLYRLYQRFSICNNVQELMAQTLAKLSLKC